MSTESDSSNIERLVEAGLIDEESLIPDAHASFLNDDLSADEVDALISILQKLDKAKIPVVQNPYYACIPIY
jgi:hypothetical protein